MNEEELLKRAEEIMGDWEQDDLLIQGLLDLYKREKEKNKKLEEVINNLAKGVRYLGTKEELATEDIIKMFSPEEIKIDFDDFMKRWENEQHKKADLKDKVIDMMAEDISNTDMFSFEGICGEKVKQYYFKNARGEENEKP